MKFVPKLVNTYSQHIDKRRVTLKPNNMSTNHCNAGNVFTSFLTSQWSSLTRTTKTVDQLSTRHGISRLFMWFSVFGQQRHSVGGRSFNRHFLFPSFLLKQIVWRQALVSWLLQHWKNRMSSTCLLMYESWRCLNETVTVLCGTHRIWRHWTSTCSCLKRTEVREDTVQATNIYFHFGYDQISGSRNLIRSCECNFQWFPFKIKFGL